MTDMTEMTTDKLLESVKNKLAETELLIRANKAISIDMMTCCPKKGIKSAAEVTEMLGGMIFSALREKDLTDEVEQLYLRRNELGTRDRAMSEMLYTMRMREKNITPEQNKENISAKNSAWECWLNAKEKKDFTLFAPALSALVKSEKERVMSWEPMSEEQRKMPAYDRMISEFERGMTPERIDTLFDESRARITALLRRIADSSRSIRTDFLSRRVTREQQQRLSHYLLGLMGFDGSRGTLAESEHPFTEQINRNDVRVTTHYYDDSFISNFYTILHEGGHALFGQMLPDEDHDCFISDNMTMGMHESVSRFYENIIGRSRPFIKLVYPELCEIFPQVFGDVTERELYEAVNRAEPSLIRTEADELTYTLHIIIRYEIEKMLIDGKIKTEDIPRVWNEKYREYLGVVPENDAEGALQDSHWSSDFGYFPTYALGNFYNSMYHNAMKKAFDVDEAVASGDLARINGWMKEHVFAKADILDADEWIRDITGEELTASYFLEYLERKYSGIYGLK
ncbi:MAG: carboxypeptidase M32 [Ruminiclostridium sp.]|nr:carboxypeptidase M32 [Ruminiclostridium sp.]